jgi:uncharacterized membrane protein
MSMLDTVLGCGLMAVIAPTFVSGCIADLFALTITRLPPRGWHCCPPC